MLQQQQISSILERVKCSIHMHPACHIYTVAAPPIAPRYQSPDSCRCIDLLWPLQYNNIPTCLATLDRCRQNLALQCLINNLLEQSNSHLGAPTSFLPSPTLRGHHELYVAATNFTWPPRTLRGRHEIHVAATNFYVPTKHPLLPGEIVIHLQQKKTRKS